MAQANLPPDEDDARFLREFDEVLSNANPNPARTGCPPRVVLSELAQHKRGLDDPVWQHLLKCSPCYRDFVAQREQRAHPVSTALLPWRSRWLAAIAMALVLVVALGGLWLSRGPAERAAGPNATASLSPMQRAEFDLRKYAVTRSVQDAGALPAVQIPAAIVELTLQPAA